MRTMYRELTMRLVVHNTPLTARQTHFHPRKTGWRMEDTERERARNGGLRASQPRFPTPGATVMAWPGLPGDLRRLHGSPHSLCLATCDF
ncbi:hypothetical protein GGTG_01331 [Gaeumannomyces tritici R3-111a-1]|uniref:Uncharacterized protein n=1 Tax=Gaeumannomyces tritici (strain R3-111a-1) TaxID=644352 RepID=J3NJ97_GAET3|nr:hypothetical protein GGTG_01331 [Gaeumannomyces tritici R3-111a-1]EJT81348.1 hypothetical protein GGTG_01331 [Gaeumannomyces tritici R3-111a-1]